MRFRSRDAVGDGIKITKSRDAVNHLFTSEAVHLMANRLALAFLLLFLLPGQVSFPFFGPYLLLIFTALQAPQVVFPETLR
jgi:hypothetical protein